MASPLTHAFVALSLGTAWSYPRLSRQGFMLGVACAEIPDLDVVGLWLGIPYGHLFGHRGFTHSIVFAALLAACVVRLSGDIAERHGFHIRIWLYFFLATVSHGACDALTDGGLGVAFFAPFDNTRYFFPFRPVVVSPLSWRDAFSAVGVKVLRSEVVWIWIPCIAFAGAWMWLQRRLRHEQP